jgi:hypothetical protein
MYDEVAIARRSRRSIMQYVAANALFFTTVAVGAVWLGAPLVATIAWVLSIINVSIAMYASIRVRRPAPMPVRAASRAMRHEVQPGVSERD